MNLEYKDRYVQAMRDFHYLPQQTFSLSNVLINADFDLECVEIGKYVKLQQIDTASWY